MAFRAPSLQTEYTDHSPFDPAFIPLEKDADAKAKEAHAAKVRRCRELGNWDELRVRDEKGEYVGEPTAFLLRPVPGAVWRPLLDLMTSGKVGGYSAASAFFRAAIKAVSNLDETGDPEVEFETLTGVPGKIATSAIADRLDALDPRIVAELGDAIAARAKAIAPRS